MAGARAVQWLDTGFVPAFVGFVPSKAAWDAEMRRHGLKDEAYPDSAAATTYLTGSGGSLVILVSLSEIRRRGRSRNQLVSLLAHEAVHVKQRILKQMREEQPGVEMEAYMVQGILQQLLYAYDRSRQK